MDTRGAINVLYGSPQGLQTIAPADQFWTQDSPWVDGTAGLGDHFGLVGSAGDFNGEGYDDLAIGVPSQSVEGQTDAGAVNVLYGSSEGLQTDNPDDPENAPDDQLWTQDSPFLGGLAEAGDVFGSQVAAGDFNGDGRDDLAVGPNGEDIEGTTNAGGVNLIYGSVVGLQAVLPDDQLWNQDEPGVTDTNEPGDRFAWDLAALDYNGDGFADLTVSIPGEDVGSIVQGGAVAVLYGSPGGVQADSPDDQFWSQEGPSVKEATEPRDAFGAALGP